MTHLFQPLDLNVNSWAERFMKEKFTMWYASKVKESLDHGVAIDYIDIKTPLTLIKPLHTKWIIDMYNQLTSEKGKEIMMSGWRASGIINAVQSGSESLQQLDPFQDVEPITFLVCSEIPLTFPSPGHENVNERYESDSEDEYVLDKENFEDDEDKERNVFDCNF